MKTDHQTYLRAKMKSKFRARCSGVAFVAVLCLPGSLAAASQMTLGEAITKALSHDPTVRKIYADVIQADGYAKETRADLRPNLSLEAAAGPANRDRSIDGLATGDGTLFSRSASLVGRQLLWSNGYYSNRYKDAKMRTEAAQMLERHQREITAFSVVEAFLDVIRGRKQISYAETNVQAHKTVLDLAKERAAAAGTQADVELSQARYDLAGLLVRERRISLLQAEARFVRLVGEPPPARLLMPKTPKIASYESIDPRLNWHYKATQKQYEAALLERKAIKGKYGPRLYLELRGTLGEDVYGIDGQDNAASAMVTMNWDLIDGGRRKAEIQQASADVERQEALIQEVLLTIEQDATAHWSDYTSLAQRIALMKEYESSLKRTVGLYREQFDLGTRPLLSMLDIQNEATSALIRLADQERDYTELGYSLLYFGGQLIPYSVGSEYVATPREPDGKPLERQMGAAPAPEGGPKEARQLGRPVRKE